MSQPSEKIEVFVDDLPSTNKNAVCAQLAIELLQNNEVSRLILAGEEGLDVIYFLQEYKEFLPASCSSNETNEEKYRSIAREIMVAYGLKHE